MIISITNKIFCVHRDLLSTNNYHINQKDSLYYSYVSIEKYT